MKKEESQILHSCVKFSLWFFNKLQKMRIEIFIEKCLEIPVNTQTFELLKDSILHDFKNDKVLYFSAMEEDVQIKILINTLKF